MTADVTLTDAEEARGRPGDHYVSWVTVYEQAVVEQIVADRLAAALPDPNQAVREAQAKAWDEGYETRAATLGMSLDPNPYREALPDPEQAVREDSLAHWLWWRFGNGTQDPAAFNALPLDADVDDKGYWEHEARAVRRAVARGGFRVTDGEPWTTQDREAHP